MKLRLYEYYIEHKDSVNKYGEILPEMQMTEYKNKEYSSTVQEAEKLKYSQKSDKVDKPPRLDFKTWLYLYITKAVKVEHMVVEEVNTKRRMYVKDSEKNEVYIFRDYDEYKKFFLMYLDDIENDVIDLAIYTKGSKGQFVALKGLC